MTRQPSPTVRGRRLGFELRRLFDASGLSGGEVARQLGWTASKLSKLLAGPRSPNPADVVKLAELLDDNPRHVEELRELARQARGIGWWHKHPLSPGLATFIGLEAEATVQRAFEQNVIPGLLQTPAYARALIAGRVPGRTPEAIAALVEVRMQRQLLLSRTDPGGQGLPVPAGFSGWAAPPDPLHLKVVIGEAALRQMVGGPEVMREQLEHLVKMADLDNITIWVLPFSVGAHQGASSFALLTLSDPLDPEVAYVEAALREIWVEDRAGVEEFGTIFENLTVTCSAHAPDSIGFITALAADLPK